MVGALVDSACLVGTAVAAVVGLALVSKRGLVSDSWGVPSALDMWTLDLFCWLEICCSPR